MESPTVNELLSSAYYHGSRQLDALDACASTNFSEKNVYKNMVL